VIFAACIAIETASISAAFSNANESGSI
jgi:hypothetical protein